MYEHSISYFSFLSLNLSFSSKFVSVVFIRCSSLRLFYMFIKIYRHTRYVDLQDDTTGNMVVHNNPIAMSQHRVGTSRKYCNYQKP